VPTKKVITSRVYLTYWVVLNALFIGLPLVSIPFVNTQKLDTSQVGNLLAASSIMFGFLAAFAGLQSDAQSLAKFYLFNFSIPVVFLVLATTVMLNVGIGVLPPAWGLFVTAISFNTSLASVILFFIRRFDEARLGLV
jgi:hypothetical protein